jgi:hypothetical protein
MDNKTALLIIKDHSENGLSYRTLGKKYGMDHMRIFRMMTSEKRKQLHIIEQKPSSEEALPNDIELLKEALRKERLKNELLNSVIDVASKELGVDIRKKSGTRRSQ